MTELLAALCSTVHFYGGIDVNCHFSSLFFCNLCQPGLGVQVFPLPDGGMAVGFAFAEKPWMARMHLSKRCLDGLGGLRRLPWNVLDRKKTWRRWRNVSSSLGQKQFDFQSLGSQKAHVDTCCTCSKF